MKYFLLGVLTTMAVLAIAVLGYIRLGFAEVRGDLPASRFESSLMRAGMQRRFAAKRRKLRTQLHQPTRT